MGLYDPWWRQFSINNVLVNIPLFGFWGIVLGIIYSKVYELVPGKGISKGLVYGLFFYFINMVRMATFHLAYARILDGAGYIFQGFFTWLIWGLVLGVLYEYLSGRFYPIKKEVKIITYDIISGILPGAIAGFCGGLAASIFQVMGHATGYWGTQAASGELVSTIEYWWSQVGTHLFINMIWGVIFGAIFAKVYNLVPGKKFKKGFYYGLIIFFITSFELGTIGVSWLLNHNAWEMAVITAGASWITGGANGIVFALVLGLLYRKPPK